MRRNSRCSKHTLSQRLVDLTHAIAKVSRAGETLLRSGEIEWIKGVIAKERDALQAELVYGDGVPFKSDK